MDEPFLNLDLGENRKRGRTALLTFGVPALLVLGLLLILILLRDGAEGMMGRLAEVLPVSYAFAAGMVASVNPCGVLMLPTYVMYHLGVDDTKSRQHLVRRALHAVRMALVVTAGFTTIFALTGAMITAGGQWLAAVFPYTGLLIGVGMVGLGVWMITGHRTMGIAAAGRVRITPQRTLANMFLFGIVYAVGSLGCTLPVFLVVVGSALAGGDPATAFNQFLGYAFGMGSVIFAVTVGTALFRRAVSRWLDHLTHYVHRFGAFFLIGAGLYLIVYWSFATDLF